MISLDDTIVAVSTPLVPAARSVVRLSGSESLRIAQSIFSAPLALNRMKPYSAARGVLRLDGIELDCSIYVMRSPRSYTRQDLVEFHLPGSPALVETALSKLISLGARAAEAGEFTQRAFLAGRIDLAQAEAVLKLIRAEDEVRHRAALEELEGRLGHICDQAGKLALKALALVELKIDFSDQDIENAGDDEIRALIDRALALVDELERSSHLRPPPGRLPRVVLAGRTNAGKSSLLNALAGKEAAIVHSRAGTTRDWLEAKIAVEEMEFVLVDTAGTAGPCNELDRKAMEHSAQARSGADFVLLAVDVTQGYGGPEREILADAPSRTAAVLTKCDLATEEAMDQLSSAVEAPMIARTSARTGRAVEDLKRAMAERLAVGGSGFGREAVVVTVRQLDALRRARDLLAEARQSSDEEIVALELREAMEKLGAITGSSIADEALNQIFSEFCIGK